MRRRGREVGLAGLLVEREDELSALEEGLQAGIDGAGRTIVIEGPVGNGKSRLLTVAGDLARNAGTSVLGAKASELEQDFSFGTAIQLLEPRWASTDLRERARLREGPTSAAAALLDGDFSVAAPSPESRGYQLIHSLFSLVGHLASGGPLAMLVDDVQWADRTSLRFLAYLADRIARLPIVLIITLSQGEPGADAPALSALRSSRTAQVLRPPALTEDGVEMIVRSDFPDAETEFIEACGAVSHGNPELLVELLAQLRADRLRPDAATAERLAGVAPQAIVNSVTARLGTMPPEARKLAYAVSVLGDGATLRHAARLGRLEPEIAAHAADRLAAIHMLRYGAPLSFVNAMIGTAVAASMTPHLREESHRQAAAILREDAAPVDAVAAHLLHSPPGDDPEDIATLQTAAHNALLTGSTASAIRMLERALAERTSVPVRAEILGELGQAEAVEGIPQATQRLREAIDLTDSPRLRSELALLLGQALYGQGCYEQAANVLEDTTAELGDDEPLAVEVEGAYISAASLVPARTDDARTRGDQFLSGLSNPPTRTERATLAHIAALAGWQCQPRERVRELVELAWTGGALPDDVAGAPRWPLLAAALLVSDELELSIKLCDTALTNSEDDEQHARSRWGHIRAWPLYHQGYISRAIADARTALDAAPGNPRMYVRTAYGALASCYIERGKLDQAETALAGTDDDEMRDSVRYPFILEVRAQLRLAQHMASEALRDATEVGARMRSDFGCDHPGVVAWRSTAALAYLALGDAQSARQLALEELELARGLGITRVVIRALRVAGRVEGGPAGIELLKEAVRTGERYPVRLEYAHALVDLGAALRRANERSAARGPLGDGLALSHEGGATALANRAREELNATGARLRRTAVIGVESLTPSELRVARLATQGLTTRQMAEALFVTAKTIEFHLRNIYQKLDVASRAELAEELGPAEFDDGSG